MAKSKSMCAGCRDNFYNGNNNLGVRECWNYESAKVISKKKISTADVPPWSHQPVVKILSCRNEHGYVFVEPSRTK